MQKATLFEKILINAYTPIEIAFSSHDLKLFSKKVQNYEFLLEAIDRKHKAFVQHYMKSYCGRIQVRLAMRRGLLTDEEYWEMHKRNLMQSNIY